MSYIMRQTKVLITIVLFVQSSIIGHSQPSRETSLSYTTYPDEWVLKFNADILIKLRKADFKDK